MACNPTRLELSNTDATTVNVTVTADPGDGTAVVLDVPDLSLTASANTSGGTVSYVIAARTENTNSLWDATIQVGANAPADIVVQIVETSAAQAVGVTISDAAVSYCAPTAPGGGGVSSLDDLSDVTISLPIAKQVLYYNGADWRNVSLSAGDIPNLDASKTTSGTFDAARIPDLSGLYADVSAAVPSGGTTGQVLSKASATDYDLTWSTATTGTVTSVGLNVPGGFTVVGTNPITSSGTFEITSTLSGVIKADGAATFSGDGAINDLADVNIAMGAGNQDDVLYYDHAAGAGSKIKGSPIANLLPAVSDSYLMLIEAPSDKDYTIDARVAAARTVTNFYAKTSSGTCTATLKNLTDATTIGTISVTSTGGSAASLTNTAIDENDRIGITISSNSSGADLEMVVEYTQ